MCKAQETCDELKLRPGLFMKGDPGSWAGARALPDVFVMGML